MVEEEKKIKESQLLYFYKHWRLGSFFRTLGGMQLYLNEDNV